MTLELYFRLIISILFQSSIPLLKFKVNYNNTYFNCPRIHAKDGFNVSLQINNGNYCESENGYRQFGYTWKYVEFGFPSQYDELFVPYAEEESNITEIVGSIPLKVLEEIFEKHGVIDWETTLSVENMKSFTRIK